DTVRGGKDDDLLHGDAGDDLMYGDDGSELSVLMTVTIPFTAIGPMTGALLWADRANKTASMLVPATISLTVMKGKIVSTATTAATVSLEAKITTFSTVVLGMTGCLAMAERIL
ncbi:MAG: hypothetical protein HC894_30245, partial [Microcoleus sp. SM1_3_4]|nr:hypothetical protein [Microcoleus sp. SM1_3_4]